MAYSFYTLSILNKEVKAPGIHPDRDFVCRYETGSKDVRLKI